MIDMGEDSLDRAAEYLAKISEITWPSKGRRRRQPGAVRHPP
jgi:hypothetical protein